MRSIGLSCTVLAMLLFFVTSAEAATCGAPRAAGEEPAFGALTLKGEQSEPNVNAGRKTNERQMVFVFGVSECSLAANEEIHAKVRSSDLDTATTFGTPEIEGEKSLLLVQIPVQPGKFDPGKHSAIVTVNGPDINPSVSKVTLQRSENRWWIPVGISVLAALIAFLVAIARAKANAEEGTEFKPLWLALAGVAALAAAAVVCKTTYFEPEVWESGVGPEFFLFVGAATAAAGAATALAGKVWAKEAEAAK